MSTPSAYLAGAAIVFVLAACSLTTVPDLTSGNGAPPREGDSGPDARPGTDGGDGASAGFCSSVAQPSTFCEDFDGDTDLGDRWTMVRPFDGTAGVELDTSVARSKPRSLLSRVLPGAGDCTYANLAKQVKGGFSAVHLGFAVQIAQASDLPTKSVIASIEIGDGNSLCQLYFSAGTDSLLVGEQIIHPSAPREERSHQMTATIPVGEWRRVELDYDVGAKKLSVTLDGETAIATDAALTCPYAPGDARGLVGLFCEPTPTAARRVHLDDVTLDVR